MKQHGNLLRDKLSEKYNFRIQKFIVDMAENPFVVEKYKENKLNVFEHNQKYLPYKQLKSKSITKNPTLRHESKLRNINDYDSTDNEIDIPVLPDIVESLHKKYANLESINQPSIRLKPKNDIERVYDSINRNNQGKGNRRALSIFSNVVKSNKDENINKTNDLLVKRKNFNMNILLDHKKQFNIIKRINIHTPKPKKGIKNSLVSNEIKRITKKPNNIHNDHIKKTYFQAASYYDIKELRNIKDSTDKLNDSNYSDEECLGKERNKKVSLNHLGINKLIEKDDFSDDYFKKIKEINESIKDKRIADKLHQIQIYNEFINRIKQKTKTNSYNMLIYWDPFLYFSTLFTEGIKNKTSLNGNDKYKNLSTIEIANALIEVDGMKNLTRKVLKACKYYK